jgi:cytochrome c553
LTLETGDGAGSSQLAVLSHAYWQRRFGGSPQAVGSAIVVNGVSFTIAGVAASGFGGVWLETPVDNWLPLTAQPLILYSQSFSADGADLRRPWLPQAGIWWLHVVARVPQAQKPAAAADKDLAGQGQKLWRGGDVAHGIPACSGCHGPAGAGIPAQFPRLSGQFAEYIAAQLTTFREGKRANDRNGVMRGVAAHMNDGQIRAVAEYAAGLRP